MYRKTYAGKFEALQGVNLEIKRGEILALLGPNGSKTTLINAICGVKFLLQKYQMDLMSLKIFEKLAR